MLGGLTFNFPVQPSASSISNATELKIVLKDGTEYDRADFEKWAGSDFEIIGLTRRELPIIRELSKLILKLTNIDG